VNAINKRDYYAAGSFLSEHMSLDLLRPVSGRSITFLYAEVLPREWRDIWSFQRRFIFRVGFKDTTNGRHVEWIEDTQMVAFIDGVAVQR
jgi:hypothetical protein